MKKNYLKTVLALSLIITASLANAGIVVLQTDFGTRDGAVSAMKGVIYSVDMNTTISDLTHDIDAFDVKEASYRLWQVVSHWPKGTVFVSVVDPGVGTNTRSIVAKSKNGYYFVTPDNGTLSYIDSYYGIEEVREIDKTHHSLPGFRDSYTFYGRDLYSNTAAKLAAGKITFNEIGGSFKKPDC